MPNPRPRLISLLLSVLTLMGMLLFASCADHHAAGSPPPAGPAFELVVESPAEGLALTVPSLEVRGRVSEAGAVVAINAETAPVDASGRFQKAFTLKPGTTTFTVEAWRNAPGTGIPPDLRLTRTVSFAWPALAITVSSPAEGAILRTTRVQVAGSVSEPTAQLTLNDRAVALEPAGTFSLPWELPSGTSTLRFQATTSDGRTAAVTRTVTVQDTSSLLKLTEPVEGLVTNATTLRVQGTVQDTPTRLVVQGQTLTPAAGPFSLTLSPAEGPLRIVAEATFADGTVATDSRNVVVDRTSPVITLVAEPPALTNEKTLVLTGSVADATATVLMLGDTPVPLDSQGRFSLPVDLKEDGSRTLQLRAVDAAGNVGTLERAVVRDTLPPAITLDAPLPSTTRAASLLVSGHIRDSHGILLASLNGSALPLDGDGHFQASWTLVSGSNTLRISATDGAGNVGAFQHTVTVGGGTDPTPPLTLTIASPGEGATVSTSPTPVSGTVSEAGASVTVNGVPLTVEGTVIHGDAALTLGENPLTFVASKDGRTATLTRTVTYLPPGVLDMPPVWLESPLDGFASPSPVVEIQGRVRNPQSAVKVNGESVPVTTEGRFTYNLGIPTPGTVKVTASAVEPSGTTGETAIYVSYDPVPPQITFTSPTPAEGARLGTARVPVAVAITKPGLVRINGTPVEPDPPLVPGGPYTARVDLDLSEGATAILAEVMDRAGNVARTSRTLSVGLAAPRITFDGPAFDESGTYRTLQATVTVTGRVEALDLAKPVTLTRNGQAVSLASDGRFSLPLSLPVGSTSLGLEATDAFGHSSSLSRTLVRAQDAWEENPEPQIRIDRPLEGFATGEAQVMVKGTVNHGDLRVTVNGASVAVDPATKGFSTLVTLKAGANTILAEGRKDTKAAQASVHGTFVVTGTANLTWELPTSGSRLTSKTIAVSGKADLPGISRVIVNGTPMALASGTFTGTVTLAAKGPQALLLEAETLAGERKSERRDVIIDVPLPYLTLVVPDAARPGEEIELKASGATLLSVDLHWNGALAASLRPPFASVKVLVPADAPLGTRIPVEAFGRDGEDETVTARAYVVALGANGAATLEAYDDRTGLGLAATASVEGTPTVIALDAAGRGTLTGLQPGGWVRVEKDQHASIWRQMPSTGLVAALVDARLTPLVAGQEVGAEAFSGAFAKGAFTVSFPAGAFPAPGSLSVTALTVNGLPSGLPPGWSPLAGFWLAGPGTTPLQAGSARVSIGSLPAASAVWCGWDAAAHAWVALKETSDPGDLLLPAYGAYVLALPDPAPTAPPGAILNQPIQPFTGPDWNPGARASGGMEPPMMATVEALRGVRALALVAVAFNGNPVPSSALMQTDFIETYTLVDQRVIEPERRTQDGYACRWVLGVDPDGAPTLRPVTEGIALELPVRMTRTFGETELAEGRIQVGFYHDGLQVAVGGEVIGAAGGSTRRDGVTVCFDAGAFASPTYVKVQADPEDQLAALWPELAGKGRLAKSFQVDMASVLAKGLSLIVEDLGSVAEGIAPILVQRRVVQGERRVVAVGALVLEGGSWKLSLPAQSNPILQGGGFAVVVPSQAWGWATGTVTMPGAMVQGFKHARGAFVRMMGSDSGDMAVVDALVSGDLLPAASGSGGVFAVPCLAARLALTGARIDLGLTGRLEVAVPSSGNVLHCATVPFRIMDVYPPEGAEVSPGAVMTVLASCPMDPAQLAGVKLATGGIDLALRRALSQEARTLVLTPEQALPAGSTFALKLEGLASLGGEVAPTLTRTFRTPALPEIPVAVDFGRIQLGYPDADYNVSMTVPEGAIPGSAGLSLEGQGMGYTFSGQMPASGPLTLVVKAALGERVKVTVQLATGKDVVGYVSRYVSTDGSGRVTLGVDGGLVATSDGKASMVLPAGALEVPAELVLENLPDVEPAELSPEQAWKPNFIGHLRLSSTTEGVQLKTRPVLRMAAPPDSKATAAPLGPYEVYDRVEGFDFDGTPTTYFELSDAGSCDGTTITTRGGLPQDASEVEAGARRAGLAPAREMGAGRASRLRLRPVLRPGSHSAQVDLFPGSMVLSCYLASNGGTANPNLTGSVYRCLPGENEQPAQGAYIFVGGNLSAQALRMGGRFVSRTNDRGHYWVLSSATNHLILNGAGVLALDADYGVSGYDRSFDLGQGVYVASAIRLEIKPEALVDAQPPWAEVRIEGRDVLADDIARKRPSYDIWAVVNAFDLRTPSEALRVEITLDGVTQDPRACIFLRAGRAGKWKVPMGDAEQGTHVLAAAVRDANGNITRISRQFRVLDFGHPGPANDASEPPSFDIEVEGGKTSANPATMIRVKFSEPLRCLGATQLVLEKFGSAAWDSVDGVRLICDAQVIGGAYWGNVHTAFLIPTGRLETGGRYRVRVVGDPLFDLDSPPKMLVQPPVEFVVAGWVELDQATMASGRRVMDMAGLGSQVFMSTGSDIQMYRIGSLSGMQPVSFGPRGAGSTFNGQTITCMTVHRQASVQGMVMDLLLVATTPLEENMDRQGALWIFNVCHGAPMPRLLAAVSLGVGVSSYVNGLDIQGGLIAVSRLGASLLIVDVDHATRGWNLLEGHLQVISAGGYNQRAIVQPLYLSNPMGTYGGGWHRGVGFLPVLPGTGGEHPRELRLCIGYSIFEVAGMNQKPLRGLARAIFETDSSGKLVLKPPYLFGGHGPDELRPDARAYGAPLPELKAAWKVSVLPRVTLGPAAGDQRSANLSLVLRQEGSSKGLRVLSILDEGDPRNASEMGRWPDRGNTPFPGADDYEFASHAPLVDPVTSLVALAARKCSTQPWTWFVLDLRDPTLPRKVAAIEGRGAAGSFSNGILMLTNAAHTGIKGYKIVDGVAGADEEECNALVGEVDIAMDGRRSGREKIDFSDIANHKYLFWVNDDADKIGLKFDIGALCDISAEDDEKVGINYGLDLLPNVVISDNNTPNIDSMRDLEDFSRVHLIISSDLLSRQGMTYWLKFENIQSIENPSIRLFKSIDNSLDYLRNVEVSFRQYMSTSDVGPVSTEETQIPNAFIDDQIVPFIFEGCSKGRGDLVFIAKQRGFEIARGKVELELRDASDFCKKYQVDPISEDADTVELIAKQILTYSYTRDQVPLDMPMSDECIVYVHGWNMGGWDSDGYEKNRWLETVFKRLWWQGYKGHVVGFFWPTLGVFDYNRSEVRAWNSACALAGLLEKLKIEYTRPLSVIAHSMGNVVTAEALRQGSNGLVDTYIATQAAIPAHMWDNRIDILENWNRFASPDIYRHHPNGDSLDSSYLHDVYRKLSNGIIQYYNPDDFALVVGWENNNNIFKPDNSEGYCYDDHDGNIDTYHPNWNNPSLGDCFRSYARTLRLPDDRFIIFGRIVQSRSKALGALGDGVQVMGFHSYRNLKALWNFNNWHYSHSRQFRSNIANEWNYWESVISDFNITQ